MAAAQEQEPRGGRLTQKASSSPPILKSSTTAKQKFLFINTSDSEPRPKSYRGDPTVRSHVMQRARKERPWSTSRQASKNGTLQHGRRVRSGGGTPPDVTKGPSDTDPPLKTERIPSPSDTNAVELFDARAIQRNYSVYDCGHPVGQGFNLNSLCRRCDTTLTQHDFFAIRTLDPFNTMSVPLDNDTQSILGYYFNNLCQLGIIPIDIHGRSDVLQSQYFPKAVSSSVFMHSLLCSTALHRYAMGQGSLQSVIHHRQRTISEVNLSLVHPKSRISDETIAAVFWLMCVEESPLILPGLGDSSHSDDQISRKMMHMEGLKRMIEMRGGLRALTSAPFVQSMILWHVSYHAIRSLDSPYISPLDDTIESYTSIYETEVGFEIGNHMRDNLQQLDVHNFLQDAVYDVAKFTSQLNKWYSGTTGIMDPMLLQNQASMLECSLLRWLNTSASHQRTPVDSTICLSLVVFTAQISEPIERSIDTLQISATKKLQQFLSSTTFQSWSQAPDTLVWVLTIALTSSKGAPEYSWFLLQALQACEELNINSLGHLLACTQSCLWVDYRMDAAIRQHWDRLQLLRDRLPHIEHLQYTSPPTDHCQKNGSNQYKSPTPAVASPLPSEISDMMSQCTICSESLHVVESKLQNSWTHNLYDWSPRLASNTPMFSSKKRRFTELIDSDTESDSRLSRTTEQMMNEYVCPSCCIISVLDIFYDEPGRLHSRTAQLRREYLDTY